MSAFGKSAFKRNVRLRPEADIPAATDFCIQTMENEVDQGPKIQSIQRAATGIARQPRDPPDFAMSVQGSNQPSVLVEALRVANARLDTDGCSAGGIMSGEPSFVTVATKLTWPASVRCHSTKTGGLGQTWEAPTRELRPPSKDGGRSG